MGTAGRSHHITKPEDKVSIGSKIGYGSGMLSYQVMINQLMSLAMPIFNDGLGIDARLIGNVMGWSRVWDAVTDPVMGTISDNTKGRWGRRCPWIAVGGLIAAVTGALIWLFPAGKSSSFYVGWFLVTSLLFYIGFTVFSVPYIALGMELSPDYHERTSVVAYRSFIGLFGGFIVSGVFWVISLSIFDNMIQGMRWCSGVIAVFVLVFSLIPAFTSREHPSVLAQQKQKPPKVKLMESVAATFTNKPFMILVGVTVFILLGVMMVSNLGYYIVIYYIFGGEKSELSGRLLFLTGSCYHVATMLMIPLLTYVSKQIGKKATMLWSMAIAFAGAILTWFCYTPEAPYLAILPAFTSAAGQCAIWTLVNAMIPETVDYDELRCGQRREGMFSAVYSWTFKLAVALALILAGYILSWSGFSPDIQVQPEKTVFMMRLLFSAVPALVIVIGFILMTLYPISEERAYAFRRELEEFRQKAEASV
ncbi:MAG: MFS transporter [Kiritimatiellales bacterium]